MNSRTNTNSRFFHRAIALAALLALITVASLRLQADTGTCGGQMITLPFTDVPSSNFLFCAIAQAFFTGLTNGISATKYGPAQNVTREQMAAFVTRTLDQSLRRGSRRAALRQFWTTQGADDLALTTVGEFPTGVESDGADLWVANNESGTISRVRASDGKLIATWTGATRAYGVLVAQGKVFITGAADPGRLYQIDPTSSPGVVTTLSSMLAPYPYGIAYDGERIWLANNIGSVSRVTLNPTNVTSITTGFSSPSGILYDGANIWVTDPGDHTLKKLDASGTVILTVNFPDAGPRFATFDGANIWVLHQLQNNVSVVRAVGGLAGTMLATLTGNGLDSPFQAAFDGERILITNNGGESVSLWKAADLTPLGTFSTGVDVRPRGVCSDGLNFWITLDPPGSTGMLARF
jgi:hypothetical protein